jgi:hypothetical protein
MARSRRRKEVESVEIADVHRSWRSMASNTQRLPRLRHGFHDTKRTERAAEGWTAAQRLEGAS